MPESVLIPCLHNESYAYLKGIKEIFELSKGLIFLSNAEKKLAERLYDIKNVKKDVIGIGIENYPKYNPENFLKKYDLKNKFILYAGRKDSGKNVDVLINYFKNYVLHNKQFTWDLVLIGGGKIDIPLEVKERIHDIGYVSTDDKYAAYSAASLLCQPSSHESFSIVIMESWISDVPVLVNDKCEVTKEFCKASNGGLYFNNYNEFAGCIDFFVNNPSISKNMGISGHKFVDKTFSWEVVLSKYRSF